MDFGNEQTGDIWVQKLTQNNSKRYVILFMMLIFADSPLGVLVQFIEQKDREPPDEEPVIVGTKATAKKFDWYKRWLKWTDQKKILFFKNYKKRNEGK